MVLISTNGVSRGQENQSDSTLGGAPGAHPNLELRATVHRAIRKVGKRRDNEAHDKGSIRIARQIRRLRY